MNSVSTTILAGSICLALFATGCGRREAAASAASIKAPEPISVRVAPAETRTLGTTVSVTGSLIPDETVTISSEVAGRVEAIYYDFGQSVRKGAVIAELDRRESTLQAERARAALGQALARIGLNPGQVEVTPETTPQIRQARAQMEEARFKYENAAKLVKTGDIAEERFVELEKQFHAREAAYQASLDELRVALANIAALRAELRLAEKRVSDATVRAPFDGAVDKRLVAPGQYLNANTPILTLVKTNPLRLRVDIPESEAAKVRPGTPLVFTTEAAPGAEFKAVVSRLNPALESRSRILTAEAKVNVTDPRLRPGVFVTVKLGIDKDVETVVVPREAIYQVAGLTKVFTVEGAKAVEHRVITGRELGSFVEIQSGDIRPGDRVAVSKIGMLTDGSPVSAAAGGAPAGLSK